MYTPDATPPTYDESILLLSDYDEAAEAHLRKVQSNDSLFLASRAKWMAKILCEEGDDVSLNAERIRRYRTGHIFDLLDDLGELDAARNESSTLSNSQRLQCGLYLAGMTDQHILKVYPAFRLSSKFLFQRNSFLKSLDDPRLSDDRKEAMSKVRQQALGRIALAVSDVMGKGPLPRPTPAPTLGTNAEPAEGINLFSDKLKIYSAKDAVGDIESRFIDAQLLSEDARGLLHQHFFETRFGMTARERKAIAKSLQSLRVVLNNRLKQEPVPVERIRLYESVQLLKHFVDHGSLIPQSRAAYMHKYSTEPLLSEEDVTRLIEKDDKRLDIAFSWLFTPIKKTPTVAQGELEPDSPDEDTDA